MFWSFISNSFHDFIFLTYLELQWIVILFSWDEIMYDLILHVRDSFFIRFEFSLLVSFLLFSPFFSYFWHSRFFYGCSVSQNILNKLVKRLLFFAFFLNVCKLENSTRTNCTSLSMQISLFDVIHVVDVYIFIYIYGRIRLSETDMSVKFFPFSYKVVMLFVEWLGHQILKELWFFWNPLLYDFSFSVSLLFFSFFGSDFVCAFIFLIIFWSLVILFTCSSTCRFPLLHLF